MQTIDENRIIRRLAGLGFAGNLLLAILKLCAGIFGHSEAMVSDAVNSFSDVVSTIVATVGVRISKRSADKSHPYGHERLESVASLLLGLLLLGTGFTVGKGGVDNIVSGHYAAVPAPGVLALVIALVCIAVKEGMYRYTRHYATLLQSSAFMAQALDHRSDVFSTLGSVVGIVGSMLGFPVLDSVAAVVICLFILKLGLSVFWNALKDLLDTPMSDEYEEAIRNFALSNDGVLAVDALRTRRFGNKAYIDLEIAIDGTTTLADAHAVAESLHDAIEERFPNVKHIMIHVNPAA